MKLLSSILSLYPVSHREFIRDLCLRSDTLLASRYHYWKRGSCPIEFHSWNKAPVTTNDFSESVLDLFPQTTNLPGARDLCGSALIQQFKYNIKYPFPCEDVRLLDTCHSLMPWLTKFNSERHMNLLDPYALVILNTWLSNFIEQTYYLDLDPYPEIANAALKMILPPEYREMLTPTREWNIQMSPDITYLCSGPLVDLQAPGDIQKSLSAVVTFLADTWIQAAGVGVQTNCVSGPDLLRGAKTLSPTEPYFPLSLAVAKGYLNPHFNSLDESYLHFIA